MIQLILNADDYGWSKIFNQKILELSRGGQLTSTSVMVGKIDESQKSQTAELIRLYKAKEIGAGVHVEFNASEPFSEQIVGQAEQFKSIFGFSPDHLDINVSKTLNPLSEQELRAAETAVQKFGFENKIAVRNFGVPASGKAKTTDASFYSHNLPEIIAFINGMQDGRTYEIIQHPGAYDPECKSSLNEERAAEYRNVIEINRIIKARPGIKLVNYLDL